LAKRDIKMVNAVAGFLGMSGQERNEFGRFLEDAKKRGERGTLNAKGDFTWDEMVEQGRTFQAERRADGE
jgi:hypothetical protein